MLGRHHYETLHEYFGRSKDFIAVNLPAAEHSDAFDSSNGQRI